MKTALAIVFSLAALLETPTGALPASAQTASPPPQRIRPGFQPQPFVDYSAFIPNRPNDATQIRLAAGRFESYRAVKRGAQEMDPALRDSSTGMLQTYLVAAAPANIVPGKTMIAVLYWRQEFPSCSSFLATDTIVSLP